MIVAIEIEWKMRSVSRPEDWWTSRQLVDVVQRETGAGVLSQAGQLQWPSLVPRSLLFAYRRGFCRINLWKSAWSRWMSTGCAGVTGSVRPFSGCLPIQNMLNVSVSVNASSAWRRLCKSCGMSQGEGEGILVVSVVATLTSDRTLLRTFELLRAPYAMIEGHRH